MIATCCIQAIALLLLILGGTYCFGIRTSILNIIQFAFNIFKTTKANALTNVTELAVAVVYVIIVIAFTKRLISDLKKTVSYKRKEDIRNQLWLSTVNDNSSAFMSYLLFCLLCNLMSEATLAWYNIVFLVISGTLAVFSKVFCAFKNEVFCSVKGDKVQKADYSFVLQYTLQILLLFALFVYFLVLFYQPWGNIMITDGKGATVTPGTGSVFIYYIYVYILNDGMTIVSFILLLSLIGKFIHLSETTSNLSSLKRKAKGMMIYNIILLALNCIVRSLFAGGDIDEISANLVKTWFQLSRSFYLPVMLLSIALHFVLSVQNIRKKEKKIVPVDNTTPGSEQTIETDDSENEQQIDSVILEKDIQELAE